MEASRGGRLRVLRALAAAACAAVLPPLVAVAPVSAGASDGPPQRSSTYLCTGYDGCREAGYSHAGYKQASDRMWWRMYTGHNCTNYVAYRMVQGGMSPERPWSGTGMAYHWGVARADITDQTPRVGAVAWYRKGAAWGGSSGHVAYVEEVVSPREVILSEDSWSGDFHWRRAVKGTSGWPTGFIHFNDRAVTQEEEPAVAGTPAVGETLTASSGRWRPAASYRYRWFVGGERVPDARSATFTPRPADEGRRVTVEVTAVRKGYLPGVATAPAVKVEPGTMRNTTAPVVRGEAQVDEVLELDPGTWSPAPAETSIQWFADGVLLREATGTRLTLGQGLIGMRISATVRTRADGYRWTDASSEPTAPVRAGTIEMHAPFAVEGATRLGRTLSVVPGRYEPADATVAYTWLRDGVPVGTGPELQLGVSDVGGRFTLQAELSRPGYRTRTEEVVVPGRVTTPPTLSVETEGKPHRAVVQVAVEAPGAPHPAGKVAVRIGKQTVTAYVVDGVARVVVGDLRPGEHRVRVHYLGSEVVEAADTTATVRVPRSGRGGR